MLLSGPAAAFTFAIHAKILVKTVVCVLLYFYMFFTDRRAEPSVQPVPSRSDADPDHGVPSHGTDPKSHTRRCRPSGGKHAYDFRHPGCPSGSPFRQPDSRAFQKSGPCPAGRKPFRRGQKAPLSCTDCGSSFFDGNTAGQAGTGQDGAAGPGLPAEGCGLLLYPG